MHNERVKAMIETWAEAGNPELELDEKEERTSAHCRFAREASAHRKPLPFHEMRRFSSKAELARRIARRERTPPG
jgi:hypothetical protein